MDLGNCSILIILMHEHMSIILELVILHELALAAAAAFLTKDYIYDFLWLKLLLRILFLWN